MQINKREMIGFNEVNKDREEKINKLKAELSDLKLKYDEKDLSLQSLTIKHKKVEESLAETRKDYDDVVDKLHKVTKARHELENQLREEIDRNKSLLDVIKVKDETLEKRIQDMDELDKRLLEAERLRESVDIKRQGIERAFDMAKK